LSSTFGAVGGVDGFSSELSLALGGREAVSELFDGGIANGATGAGDATGIGVDGATGAGGVGVVGGMPVGVGLIGTALGCG